jgi:hypothetical protein
MSLRIRGHADRIERVIELLHQADERQPIVDLPTVLGVAADHERSSDPARPASIEQLREMGSVADHVRGQMRGGIVTSGHEGFAQLDRGLDPVARRGCHGGPRSRRQRFGSIERIPERDQLEERPPDQRPQRRSFRIGKVDGRTPPECHHGGILTDVTGRRCVVTGPPVTVH